jgi:hypothetical protein
MVNQNQNLYTEKRNKSIAELCSLFPKLSELIVTPEDYNSDKYKDYLNQSHLKNILIKGYTEANAIKKAESVNTSYFSVGTLTEALFTGNQKVIDSFYVNTSSYSYPDTSTLQLATITNTINYCKERNITLDSLKYEDYMFIHSVTGHKQMTVDKMIVLCSTYKDDIVNITNALSNDLCIISKDSYNKCLDNVAALKRSYIYKEVIENNNDFITVFDVPLADDVIMQKIRIDCLIVNKVTKRISIIDFKTTSGNIGALSIDTTIKKYMYDLQLWFYKKFLNFTLDNYNINTYILFTNSVEVVFLQVMTTDIDKDVINNAVDTITYLTNSTADTDTAFSNMICKKFYEF